MQNGLPRLIEGAVRASISAWWEFSDEARAACSIRSPPLGYSSQFFESLANGGERPPYFLAAQNIKCTPSDGLL